MSKCFETDMIYWHFFYLFCFQILAVCLQEKQEDNHLNSFKNDLVILNALVILSACLKNDFHNSESFGIIKLKIFAIFK